MNAKAGILILVANALISAALVLGHAAWVSPAEPQRLAVLDVAEIYRLKETQVTTVLTKRDATDEERTRALSGAGGFGIELGKLIHVLADECRCLVLARGAVIGQGLPDLTPEVRKRLGL